MSKKYIYEYMVFVPVELTEEEHNLDVSEREEVVTEKGEKALKNGEGQADFSMLDVKELCLYCDRGNQSKHFICQSCGSGMCEECYKNGLEHDETCFDFHESVEEDLYAYIVEQTKSDYGYMCFECIDKFREKKILDKVKEKLGDQYTWWFEDKTLYIENNSKQSEVYLPDLINDFDKSIDTIIEEVTN